MINPPAPPSDWLELLAFVGALICAGLVCAAVLGGCFLLMVPKVEDQAED